MMGRKHREQGSLFYEFRLDDMVPKDHLLRRINVFVTSALSDLHKELGRFYSDIGRPSIDPERRYKRQPPKVISPSDPQSAWTAKANKRVQFGYGLNYLIDVKNAVIVDVEATPARTYDEVAATQTMLERTQERFDLKPKRLAANMAYGTGKFLGWLVKIKKITPHIPVWDKSDRQDGVFSRSDFRWDSKRQVYICPNGKLLRTSGTVHDGRTLLYRASKAGLRCVPDPSEVLHHGRGAQDPARSP
jgi:hypothetical protein